MLCFVFILAVMRELQLGEVSYFKASRSANSSGFQLAIHLLPSLLAVENKAVREKSIS